MKREINVFDYANDIMKNLTSGILVTTKSKNEVNTMTISWGSLGIEWAKPIFIAYIRNSRHTKKLLEENAEFTVNIPIDKSAVEILKIAGTKSGKDIDKIKDLGLTLIEPNSISVPAIKEVPLTLECKVVYVQDQDKNAITPENDKRFYPTKDYHTAYYGEIVSAYIVE